MIDTEKRRLYCQIAQRHLHVPEVAVTSSTTFLGGNDHDVLVFAQRLAFRFPRVPRQIDRRRARFLELLAPRSPLPLPLSEVHVDPVTGIEYEVNTFIPGVAFTPELAQTFSTDELLAVARGLGAFLSAVHAFPLAEARALGLDEVNPLDFWEYVERNPSALPQYRRTIYPLVTARERTWIEQTFAEYIALIKTRPFPLRVTHADVWSYHIIVNVRTRTLAGVVDFWGRIADPARDFKAFEYYGPDFVREVYAYYTGAVDDDFERRRLFYTAYDEMFELTRQIESGDAATIAQRRRSLAIYIAAHPLS